MTLIYAATIYAWLKRRHDSKTKGPTWGDLWEELKHPKADFS
jgi:hypothetical protein